MSDIILRKYDYDKNQTVEVGTVSTDLVARNVSPEQIADILDSYLNVIGRTTGGYEVGKKLALTHPTLQRLAVLFAIDMLCGISERNHTDARNADAIETAKKIKAMREADELPIGQFI